MEKICEIYGCDGVCSDERPNAPCSKCGFSEADIREFGSNIPELIKGRMSQRKYNNYFLDKCAETML